ncbi:MAG TPA: hypothetical protein VHO95_13430, partial [Candidatus Dormibacteraeota bacterium]|nr:hypothetical protein [Candidatus Dormibacteraeota bacterium]
GVGLIGAAMALTRTYLIPVFVLAVIVSFLIRYRPRPRVIALLAIAMLIMGGAEAGHRIGMYEHHQNFFWDTGGYLRWDANQELFRYHRPLPHPELFPSLREYQAEGTYAGTRPTTYQYFFEIHSPLEFARDSLAGAAEIFDTMDSFSVDVGELTRVRHVPDSVVSLGNAVALRIDLVVRWMVLLGLMGMVVRARRHPLFLLAPVMIVSWLGTTAFLFDHGLIERYRHTWQVYPLALIAGVWLLETCYVVLRHYVPWQRLLRVDWLLITAVLLLAIVERSAPGSTQLVAAVLLAAGVDVLSYRRPGWGIGVMLVAMSTDSTVVGAGVSLTCLGGILAKLRPELRMQAWLVALLPLAAAIVLGAERPSAESIEIAVAMVASAGAVAVAARQDRVRQELLMVLAATGPLAGITYFLEPLAPSAVMLTAVGAVAATWLYLDGRRWALPFGLLDLALVIVIEPFAAWLGVAAALVWLAFNSGRFKLLRRRVSIAGGLAIAFAVLTAGASLAGTTAPAASAWTMRMTTSTSTVEQLITVDRPGDTSIWIYARRASALTDYPFTLTVNGNEVTSDLNSYLLTDPMAWVRVPLPRSPRVGDRLDVKVAAGGAPDAVDRYIEVGGVYAAVNGITSPGVNGTFLIVLGDDSLPLAPGGLPEPLVRNRLQPPMGDWMPGEVRGELDSREQAGTLQIWQETLKIATAHPLGTGTGTLSNYLLGSRAGLGPGLTARSAYLQAVAEWGFAGLAGLLIAVGAAAWFVLRSRDPLAAALLILAVIAMAGESILSDQAGALTVWIGLGFCFGSIGSRAAFPSTSRASGDETRTTTSPPEASHAG